MWRKAKRFLALSGRQKAMFVEAWFRLAWVRLALAMRPFKTLVSGLQAHAGVAESSAPAEGARSVADDIGRAVRMAARYTPWTSACLAQALTAQRMLAGRGIAGAMVLAASVPGGAEGDAMAAHAWVKCGEQFLTGEAGHERYTPVSTFTWAGRR